MAWSPYKESMNHFLVPKPTQKYKEKIHHLIYFENGLEEPRKFVFNSSSIPVSLFLNNGWKYVYSGILLSYMI